VLALDFQWKMSQLLSAGKMESKTNEMLRLASSKRFEDDGAKFTVRGEF
jgi:hypothetical protein